MRVWRVGQNLPHTSTFSNRLSRLLEHVSRRCHVTEYPSGLSPCSEFLHNPKVFCVASANSAKSTPSATVISLNNFVHSSSLNFLEGGWEGDTGALLVSKQIKIYIFQLCITLCALLLSQSMFNINFRPDTSTLQYVSLFEGNVCDNGPLKTVSICIKPHEH